MKRIVLKFDKENITAEEIQEHIEWYMLKVDEGRAFLAENNNREAMRVLREINTCLDQEYRYYSRSSVEKVMLYDSSLKKRYCDGVCDANIKQTRRTTYDMLSSNFYDIWSYLSEIND